MYDEGVMDSLSIPPRQGGGGGVKLYSHKFLSGKSHSLLSEMWEASRYLLEVKGEGYIRDLG